jgi:ketosteroid isomerase-like protein
MSAQAAIDRINAATDAFRKGDLASVLANFGPDIVWKVPGSNSLTGDYEGREQLGKFFGGVFEKTQGSATLELEKVLANDQHSIHFIRLNATRDGTQYTLTVANFGEHGEDGLARRMWFIPDDLAAMDRLFA